MTRAHRTFGYLAPCGCGGDFALARSGAAPRGCMRCPFGAPHAVSDAGQTAAARRRRSRVQSVSA